MYEVTFCSESGKLDARVGRDLEAAPEGGVLHHAVGGAGQCPPGLGGLAEEIERLRAEPGEADIAIGGATLAAEAACSSAKVCVSGELYVYEGYVQLEAWSPSQIMVLN